MFKIITDIDKIKGVWKNKEGVYRYRKVIDGKREYFYSKDYDEIVTIANYFNDERNVNKAKKAVSKYKNGIKNRIDPNLKDGYVYLITDEKYVKIGVAKSVENRIKTLQTGNPKQLRLIKTIHTYNPYKLETDLHNLFENKRVNNEWFDVLDVFG